MKRLLIIIITLLVVSEKSRAQYDPYFSHYFDMETSFNPAAVGKQSKINVTAAYAYNMAGFENNPQTAYAAADMPLYAMRKYHGVGVQFQNDKIGLFAHQKLAAQYAMKFGLLGGQMSVGLQAGLLSESFDGNKLDIENEDKVFTKSELTGNSLDLAFGLYYTHGQWYTGFSVQHITDPLVKLGETNELKIDKTYYLTGGYNIKLRNPFLQIKPSLLVRTDMTALRADFTGRLVYTHDDKMMYGGLAYSPTNSVTVLLGGNFHGITLGYSYEVYTSAISIGNGSHELFVGYQHDINLFKKGKNLHKSVRIL